MRARQNLFLFQFAMTALLATARLESRDCTLCVVHCAPSRQGLLSRVSMK